jgi:hypothetical protein
MKIVIALLFVSNLAGCKRNSARYESVESQDWNIHKEQYCELNPTVPLLSCNPVMPVQQMLVTYRGKQMTTEHSIWVCDRIETGLSCDPLDKQFVVRVVKTELIVDHDLRDDPEVCWVTAQNDELTSRATNYQPLCPTNVGDLLVKSGDWMLSPSRPFTLDGWDWPLYVKSTAKRQ